LFPEPFKFTLESSDELWSAARTGAVYPVNSAKPIDWPISGNIFLIGKSHIKIISCLVKPEKQSNLITNLSKTIS
jgi:hypothetical protein